MNDCAPAGYRLVSGRFSRVFGGFGPPFRPRGWDEPVQPEAPNPGEGLRGPPQPALTTAAAIVEPVQPRAASPAIAGIEPQPAETFRPAGCPPKDHIDIAEREFLKGVRWSLIYSTVYTDFWTKKPSEQKELSTNLRKAVKARIRRRSRPARQGS